MPANTTLESERQVLGVILYAAEPGLYDSLGLREADFADPKHRAVWRAIGQVIDAGLRPDVVTVGQRCKEQAADVAELSSTFAAPENVRLHAQQIRDAARQRRVEQAIPRLQDAVKLGAEAFCSEAEAILSELSGEPTGGIRSLGELLPLATKEIERRMNGETGALASGFPRVDHYARGFRPGDLIVIAARTSIGKTALALSMAHSMKCPVGYFTLEMSGAQIAERLLAIDGQLCTMFVDGSNWNKVTDAADRLSGRPFFVDDTPALTLSALRSRARTMKRRGAQVVFVDYLTLVQHGDSKMPRYERVGEVTKGLKSLARELGVPVVALSQLNRLAEGVKPGLEQLRQSGEIEEDADLVLLLHRERDDSTAAELRIGKNRRGPCGVVPLVFIAGQARFEESRS